MTNIKRPLRVFLCHASGDKSAVIKLYAHLVKDGIDAWLDKEKIIPGQDWRIEIPKAVKNSDVVIVCLSSQSVTKEGFVQKEIRYALDAADEKPDGTIFIIPTRLENCTVPDRINRFHWVDLFLDDGYERLFKALTVRAAELKITFEKNPVFNDSPATKKKDQEILDVPISNITHQTSTYEECPSCGKQNELPNTFKCKKCKRSFLCLEHLDKKALVCQECTAEICSLIQRFMNDIRTVTPPYESNNAKELTNIAILNRTMTSNSINAYKKKRWDWLCHLRRDGSTYLKVFEQCEITNIRVVSETAIRVDVIETWFSKFLKADESKFTTETYNENETYDFVLEKDSWKINQSNRLSMAT